jgi:hypothetical protein
LFSIKDWMYVWSFVRRTIFLSRTK